MKKVFIFLSNWTLVASLIVAAATSLVIPEKTIVSFFSKTLICDYYFYENINCLALDVYSTYILNFMTISILILTISYGISLIQVIYYFLQSVFFTPESTNIFTSIEIPNISIIFKESLMKIFIIAAGIFLFWGRSGLTHFDSILVASVNTIIIYWVCSVTLVALFLFLNLFVKGKFR